VRFKSSLLALAIQAPGFTRAGSEPLRTMTRLGYEAARIAEGELHSVQTDSGRTKLNPQSSEQPHTAGLKRAGSKPLGAMTRLTYEAARIAEKELHSAGAVSSGTELRGFSGPRI
jgi:hypothetical protein